MQEALSSIPSTTSSTVEVLRVAARVSQMEAVGTEVQDHLWTWSQTVPHQPRFWEIPPQKQTHNWGQEQLKRIGKFLVCGQARHLSQNKETYLGYWHNEGSRTPPQNAQYQVYHLDKTSCLAKYWKGKERCEQCYSSEGKGFPYTNLIALKRNVSWQSGA